MKVCIFFSHNKLRVEDLLLKLIGQKDYPKNGTFFDASLPEIESILFDACM